MKDFFSRNRTGAKRQPSGVRHAPLREAALFLMMAVALYLTLALLSYDRNDPSWSHSGPDSGVANLGGVLGAYFADLAVHLFGAFALGLPLALVLVALSWYRKIYETPGGLGWRMTGLLLLMTGGGALAGAFWPLSWWVLPDAGAGGLWGRWMNAQGVSLLNQTGASILFGVMALAGVSLLMNRTWAQMIAALRARRARQQVHKAPARAWRAARDEVTPATLAEPIPDEVLYAPDLDTDLSVSIDHDTEDFPIAAPRAPVQASFTDLGLPPLDLLDEAPALAEQESESALSQRARMLEQKLADFGVSAQVTGVFPGPVITRFEIEPAPGVKVNQVSNLSKDLARAMSATSVRVVETIPGKSVMGIEIPNAKRSVVRLRENLADASFTHMASPLSLALGKDISGKPVAADLAKMPHLLVAGTTGSGKSVAVNAMILSLLYKARPDEVRLIMIDPKMLELSVYEGIPHLLTPVVTDMKEAASALRWCVAEMERRYKMMASVGVRNLAGFNKKVSEASAAGRPLYDPKPTIGHETAPVLKPMPMIVVLIDELADLMMVVGKQVEDLITRLAQKARAAGVHMIMATQRPSVDVITGLIKANVPTRISFQVSSKIDSRTILDQGGAEQLLGQGDMLYLPPGTGHPTRVHGAFVSDDEVHRVVSFLKQQGAPDYVEEILQGAEESGEDADGEGGEADPLYDAAVAIVTESRKASISMVQRRLRVGYNRAARMIEEMERAGVVGPLQGNGTREVYAQAAYRD